MVNLWNWLKAHIWCDHQWRYVDTIEDQDLRSGYKFWAARYVCRRCSRFKTIEKRDDPR